MSAHLFWLFYVELSTRLIEIKRMCRPLKISSSQILAQALRVSFFLKNHFPQLARAVKGSNIFKLSNSAYYFFQPTRCKFETILNMLSYKVTLLYINIVNFIYAIQINLAKYLQVSNLKPSFLCLMEHFDTSYSIIAYHTAVNLCPNQYHETCFTSMFQLHELNLK